MASEPRDLDRDSTRPLLASHEPAPVALINPDGGSSFLLIGDHAGNRIPERLSDLGLEPADRERHIAIDIGVGGLGETLAERLDALFIRQTYSRLVIDCNRDPAAADSIPETSDGTLVPGNVGLDRVERAARLAEIQSPYQSAIAEALSRRDAAGRDTILIALHSFTPRMNDIDRVWHVGVLHDGGDTRFAHALLATLREDPALVVGDNEPYRMDLIDYTIPRHAYPALRPYAELEIRQDLMESDAGIARIADLLVPALIAASAALDLAPRG
jgi:predicted N-formylglutamate amidohydrolase